MIKLPLLDWVYYNNPPIDCNLSTDCFTFPSGCHDKKASLVTQESAILIGSFHGSRVMKEEECAHFELINPLASNNNVVRRTNKKDLLKFSLLARKSGSMRKGLATRQTEIEADTSSLQVAFIAACSRSCLLLNQAQPADKVNQKKIYIKIKK